uniref:Uncharacterized protein n=2 Tax=Schistocephalus solidus TaxID=70667 RepID=A0A0X3P1T4_SCHSO
MKPTPSSPVGLTSETMKSDEILRSVYGIPTVEPPTLVPSAAKPAIPPKTPTSPQRILPTRLPPLVNLDHITPFTASTTPKFRVPEPSSQTLTRQPPRKVSEAAAAATEPTASSQTRSASVGRPIDSQLGRGSAGQHPTPAEPSNYVWDAWEQAVIGAPRAAYRQFAGPAPPNVLSPAHLFPQRPPTIVQIPSWAPPTWYPPPTGYYPMGSYPTNFQAIQSFGTFPRTPKQRQHVDAVFATEIHEAPVMPTTYHPVMASGQRLKPYVNGESNRQPPTTHMYSASTATESKGDSSSTTIKRYSVAQTSPLEDDLLDGTTLRSQLGDTSIGKSQRMRPQKAANHLRATSLQTQDEEIDGGAAPGQQQDYWPPLYYPPFPQGQYYSTYGPPPPGMIMAPYGQPFLSPNPWDPMSAPAMPPEEHSRRSSNQNSASRNRHTHRHYAGGSLDRHRRKHHNSRLNSSSRTYQNGQELTNGRQDTSVSKRQFRPFSESGSYGRIENVPTLGPVPKGHRTDPNSVSLQASVPEQRREPAREVSADRREDEIIQRKVQQIEREPNVAGERVFSTKLVLNSVKPGLNVHSYGITLKSTQDPQSVNLYSNQTEASVVTSTVPTVSRTSYLQSSSNNSSITEVPRTVPVSSVEHKKVQPLHVLTTSQQQQRQHQPLETSAGPNEPGMVYSSQTVRDLNRRFMQMSASQSQNSSTSAKVQYLQHITSPAEQTKKGDYSSNMSRGPVVRELVQRYSGGETFFPNQNRQDDTSAVELSELDEALASGEISFSDEVDYSSAR